MQTYSFSLIHMICTACSIGEHLREQHQTFQVVHEYVHFLSYSSNTSLHCGRQLLPFPTLSHVIIPHFIDHLPRINKFHNNKAIQNS